METCHPEEKQPGLETRPGDAWPTCVDASGVRAWEQLRGPGFLSEWILSVGAVCVPEGPRPLRCGQVGVRARRPSPGLSLSSFPGFAPFWAGLLRCHVGAVAAPHAPGVRVRPEQGLLPQAPKPKTRCVPGAPIWSHTTPQTVTMASAMRSTDWRGPCAPSLVSGETPQGHLADGRITERVSREVGRAAWSGQRTTTVPPSSVRHFLLERSPQMCAWSPLHPGPPAHP